MDLATFGIVIDPRQARDGGDQTKAVLKSIEVTAKETQAGVVAAFVYTENQRKITIRDSAAVQKQVGTEVTAAEQGEAAKRKQIDQATAAANRERLQERLAATQKAMEQMAVAEIDTARRASAAAIAAANATKESSLAAIEAVRAGRLQAAKEAMEEAASSTEATRAALARQAAAERDLNATQRELLQQHVGDSRAAANQAAEAQKAASLEIATAEKAAQEEIRLQTKLTLEQEKAAAAQRIADAKAATAAAKAAQKAANDAESGWGKFERAGVQALAMMGLVAPQANTALIGMQALQTGMELTGIGFLTLTGIVTGFIAVAAGLAGVALLIKGLVDAAHLEPLENQLGNAVQDFGELQKRMEMIRDIQHEAGGLWNVDSIILANRELQLFTKGALAGADGMKMVGDAAVVAGKPIDQVAASVGKLYGAIQGRDPIDRYVKSLISLRVLEQGQANELINLQSHGASPEVIWAKAEAALKRYNGAMDQYGNTAVGTIGKIKVDIDRVLEAFAKPLLPLIEPGLKALEERLAGIAPKAAEAGRVIAAAIGQADWDTTWTYVSLRLQLALNMAWKATVDYFWKLLSSLPERFMTAMKEQFTTIPGLLNLWIPGAGTVYSAAKGTVAAVSGPANGDIQKLTEAIHSIEEKWTTAATDAQVKAWSAAGRPGTPGAGDGEELNKLKDDAAVMAEFIRQLKTLTDKLSKNDIGQGEFDYRRQQLQQRTIGELGDPRKANDIYSNPTAADKTWQDVLGKWRVFQEEKARVAELADARIKAGDATVTDSLIAGLKKTADQWGNLQQHIAKGVQDIANSISSNLTTALTAFITGAKDAKTAFRDMTVAILNDIVRVCVQLLVELAIRQAIKALGYANGGSVGQIGNAGSMDSQALAFDGGQTSDMTAVPSGATSTGTIGGGSISPVEPPLPTNGGGLDQTDIPGQTDVPGTPGFRLHMAGGGNVWGGNGGIDDIPARLTRGEYVIPKDAAAYYGTQFLDGVRDQRVKVRGFAAGGPVPGPVTANGRGGGSGDSFNISIAVDGGAGKGTGSKKDGTSDDAERMKQLAKLIADGARNTIVREQRSGGLLNSTATR